jgi:hypothetical protein
MGYGRSGSTLLDILLGENKQTFSVGGLSNYHLWLEQNLKCACNQRIKECSFWSQINDKVSFSEEDVRIVKKYESLYSLFSLAMFRNSKNLKKYCISNQKLLSAISEHSNKDIIVDSSKTSRDCLSRPIMLLKKCKINLDCIFLVRDPRGVVWSAMKKHGSPERERRDFRFTRFIRTLIAWNIINYLTIFINKFFIKKNLFIRYEDFCEDTVGTLHLIEEFSEIDLSQVIFLINNNMPINIRHNLGGNRLRFSSSINSIKFDQTWKNEMPQSYQIIVKIFSYPLMKRFGF